MPQPEVFVPILLILHEAISPEPNRNPKLITSQQHVGRLSDKPYPLFALRRAPVFPLPAQTARLPPKRPAPYRIPHIHPQDIARVQRPG